MAENELRIPTVYATLCIALYEYIFGKEPENPVS